MRTILRVGTTIGGIAFVMLYALQSAIALAVALGIILAGVSAGLGTAKWLERPWFGRQFAAGLRTGIIAVGMAGAGALLALLGQGPRSIDQLAARSHFFSVNLGPVIYKLSGAGWVGVDVLAIFVAMATGIAASVVITQVGAWTKSRRAIQAVARARIAAKGSGIDDRAGASSGRPFGGAGATPVSTPGRTGPQRIRTDSTFPFGDQPFAPPPATPPRFQEPATPPRFQEIDSTPRGMAQRQPSKGRPPSKARPAETQLTEAMREALATWAGDNDAADPAAPRSGSAESARARTPQPSEYLNSMPPSHGKRARKKQNTEWIN